MATPLTSGLEGSSFLMGGTTSQSVFPILPPLGGIDTCVHARQYPQHRTNNVANFGIGPITVADITLSSCVEALVRLKFTILLVAQFSHSPPLLNSPKW